jgi:CheY-like chemotaxis protein
MSEGGAGLRVLVVTQDGEVRVLLRRLLRSIGQEVELVGEVGEAEARLETDRPALVVLDLGLPHRAAWPMLARVPAIATAPPVVALVPHGDYRGLAQAIRDGAAACLFRPFHDDDFVAVCQAVLGRAERPAPVEERRLGARRIVVASVDVSAQGVSFGPGELADLGIGGAQVRLPVRVEPGTRVRLTLPVRVGKPLSFEATVQWNRRARNGFAHGLQFLDLTLALRRQLGDLLDAAPA